MCVRHLVRLYFSKMSQCYAIYRYLNKYLSWSEWRNLTVALRLAPNTAQRFRNLRKVALASIHSEGIYDDVREPGNECNSREIPKGAFIVDDSYIVMTLPWVEPDSHVVLPIEASNLLRAVVSSNRFRIKALSVHFCLPLIGLPRFLSALNDVLAHYAGVIEELALSCEVTGGMGVRSVDILAEPQTRGLLSEVDSWDGPVAVDFRELMSRKVRFCKLQRLHLSVPYTWPEDNTGNFAPNLEGVYIRALSDDVIQFWCLNIGKRRRLSRCNVDNTPVCPRLQELMKRLYIDQCSEFDFLLWSTCLTVQDLHFTADAATKDRTDVFRKFRFLPQLKYVNLGWTTELELENLYASLSPCWISVSELLAIPGLSHVGLGAVLHSQEQSINSLPMQEETDDSAKEERNLHVSSATGTSRTLIPPRLPRLERLDFSGPMRAGLSDLHLKLYLTVNKVRELHV